MFQEIENIREEIVAYIRDVTAPKSEYGIDEYLSPWKGDKKLTKQEARNAIEYFLNKVKDKIDYRLLNYLSDEARVLKAALDREDYDED
jgi:hypothetical protein